MIRPVASPRQNRINPFGDPIADPARGSYMGNRGCLHDPHGNIVRHHVGRRWIYCLLAFRGWHREIMVPGRYTELFFLDEATALAAGHRPCFECQRERALEFARAWAAGNPGCFDGGRPTATELDRELHHGRLDGRHGKRTFTARAGDLPDGTFVVSAGSDRGASLLWEGNLHEWSPSGYGPGTELPADAALTVLTPAPTVRALARFRPGVSLSP